MSTLLYVVVKRTEGFSADENLLHSQYNALRHLIYRKQSYCKDIQIYTIIGTHER